MFRAATAALMQRAEQAGARAIVVTVDAAVPGIRSTHRAEPENTMVLAGRVTIC
ncbi:MAG: alpha-hydroxy-acid oxidizing protein [Xanthobacteraceae bacterium]